MADCHCAWKSQMAWLLAVLAASRDACRHFHHNDGSSFRAGCLAFGLLLHCRSQDCTQRRGSSARCIVLMFFEVQYGRPYQRKTPAGAWRFGLGYA